MRVSIAWLKLVTLAYVVFPFFPFFIGWVKPIYAIPLCGLLILGIYNFIKDLDFRQKERYSTRWVIATLVLLGIWFSFSGTGGVGYQVSDLDKVNSIVKDLSELPWPVSYEVDGEKLYFSHYLAYYLPGPTLVGFLGYKFVQLFLFLFTALGFVLGIFWLVRFAGEHLFKFTLLFILFGGVSIVSFLIKFGIGTFSEIWLRLQNHGFVFWMNCWDVIPLNYNSITDMLYWTPNHGIAAFIGVGLVLNDTFVDRKINYLPFFLSLLLFWSPLVLVGLFPFFLYSLTYHRFKGIWNVTNLLVAPLVFICIAFFLLSIESSDLVKHFIFSPMELDLHTVWEKVGVYLYFVFFEVIIWAGPIYYFFNKHFKKDEKSLFLFAVGLLILIPLYRFGLWNDWCTRVSYPALIVLAVFAVKAILNSSQWRQIALLAILICGSLSAVLAIGGSAMEKNFRISFDPPPAHQVEDLPGVCVWYPLDQFVAKEDTFFFKYLAQDEDGF